MIIKKGIWILLASLIALPIPLLHAPAPGEWQPEKFKSEEIRQKEVEAKRAEEQQQEQLREAKSAFEQTVKKGADVNRQYYEQQKRKLAQSASTNIDDLTRAKVITSGTDVLKQMPSTTPIEQTALAKQYNELSSLAKKIGSEQLLDTFIVKNKQVRDTLIDYYTDQLKEETNPLAKRTITEQLISVYDAPLKALTETHTIEALEQRRPPEMLEFENQKFLFGAIKNRLDLLEMVPTTQRPAIEEQLNALFEQVDYAKRSNITDVDFKIQLQKMKLLALEYNKYKILNPEIKPSRGSLSNIENTLNMISTDEEKINTDLISLLQQKIKVLNKALVSADPAQKPDLQQQRSQVLSDMVESALQAAQNGKKIDVQVITTLLDEDITSKSKALTALKGKIAGIQSVTGLTDLSMQFLKERGETPQQALATVIQSYVEKAWMETIGKDGSFDSFLKSLTRSLELSQKVFDEVSPDLSATTKTALSALRIISSIPKGLDALQSGFAKFGTPTLKPEQLAEDYAEQAKKALAALKKTPKDLQLYYDTLRNYENTLRYYDNAIKTAQGVARNILLSDKQKFMDDILTKENFQGLKDTMDQEVKIGRVNFSNPPFEQNYLKDVAAYVDIGAPRAKSKLIKVLPKDGFANLIEKHNLKIFSPEVKLRVYQFARLALMASALITLLSTGVGIWEIIKKFTSSEA